MEVCRTHGSVVRQCRCPGEKARRMVDCPGETCRGFLVQPFEAPVLLGGDVDRRVGRVVLDVETDREIAEGVGEYTLVPGVLGRLAGGGVRVLAWSLVAEPAARGKHFKRWS